MIMGICKNKLSYKDDQTTIFSDYLYVTNITTNIEDELNLYDIGIYNLNEQYIKKMLNKITDDKLKELLIKISQRKDIHLFKIVVTKSDKVPNSVEEVLLKLNAISRKIHKPREQNLDGSFGILKNLAWVGNTPIELDYLRENEIDLKLEGKYPNIDYVDKFPRYLHSIIPENNTRILNSSNVRFGAYLSAGTTVMPGASYINFNAGTTGPCMVEGRVSSSVIVGKNTDIGGGASILGVLSGTNGNPISIGNNSLLGANSVTGIPLGDGCIVDAGIAVLEGSKIEISGDDYMKIKEINIDATFTRKDIYKGYELQFLNGIHYRINSQTGRMIAKRSSRDVSLNSDLH